MNRLIVNLIAAAERSERGYADVPPGSINDEIESELAAYGYAHVGQQVFTLLDTRAWWVLANFRETQLKHIEPGMSADVYLMSDPGSRLSGVVESIGYGVTPDPSIVRGATSGLPDVQRTLSWVHLASRYPVRIRIQSPSDAVRLGESAVVVIRGFKGRP